MLEASSKRRRTSADLNIMESIICLSGLPTGLLAQTASFLPPQSRVLFASALEDNDNVDSRNNVTYSKNEERSKAIIGEVEMIDFGESDTDLAAKFRDADVRAILIRIDAVNNLSD